MIRLAVDRWRVWSIAQRAPTSSIIGRVDAIAATDYPNLSAWVKRDQSCS